jgi:hypothetical protein
VFHNISIVISHCLWPLHWIETLTEGFAIDQITVISKCGKPVEGAPKNAVIHHLPSIGRMR